MKCVFLVLFLFALPAFAAETTVTKDGARLFRIQDPESPTIATLEKGEKLEVIALGDEWTMVRTPKGVIGWVQSSYVSGSTEAFRDQVTRIRPEDKPTKVDFLKKCLKAADSSFEQSWSDSCSANGRGSGCTTLPNDVADSLKRDRRSSRKECLDLSNSAAK
jgi:Bacterial SH3 domain